jgi:homoserine kinase type II
VVPIIQNVNELRLEEIATNLKEKFGLSVRETTPIDKGWMNVKWKIVTDDQTYFVKYYHPERYKLHTSLERRKAMERTLQLQQGLSGAGIPCPKVRHYEGQSIQETRSGSHYTLQDWVEGRTAQAGCLNKDQMYELGIATGRMHDWLRTHAPADKLAWKPDRDVYWREWQVNWAKANETEDQTVIEWLRRSQAIVQTLDFRIFDSCPTGWLHWDLWVDNILLNGNTVAGIVDFDRMAVAYPEIDIARAILSGALGNDGLQIEKVLAYMKGYREVETVPPGVLSRSMRMLYLIESIWWLRTEIRLQSELRGLLGRFVEEMHWIEDNWEKLAEQLDAC